jgi:hypothetical protein
MAEFYQLVRIVPDFAFGSARVLSDGPHTVFVGTREACEDEQRLREVADNREAEGLHDCIAEYSLNLAQYQIQPLLL